MTKFIISLIVLFGIFTFIGYKIFKLDQKRIQDLNTSIETSIQTSIEQAYFLGQKDAINGKVKIKWVPSDSTYIWTSNPYKNSIRKPIYIPTKEDSKP